MKANANVARFPMYVVVKSVVSDGKKSRGMVKDRVAANGNVEMVTARFATRADAQRVAADCQNGQLDAFSWYVLDSRETDAASYAAKHVNRLPRHLKEILHGEGLRRREREEEVIKQAERAALVEYEAKRRAPTVAAEADAECLGFSVSL